MDLPDYIQARKIRIIDQWKQLAVERLALRLEESQLVDDLPNVIDDLAATLRHPEGHWPTVESAKDHGRHRMRTGVDIGSLTQEMALVVEAVCAVSIADGHPLSCDHMQRVLRIMSRGTSASVNSYAALRDEEVAREARRHFSFVAHELRTPLQTARTSATLLNTVDEKHRTKIMARLERALTQMTDLVDNSLSRMRVADTPDLQLAVFSVKEIAQAAYDNVIDHVEVRGMSLNREIDSFEIEADQNLLLSAVTNLLKNAVKFTRPQGHIVLRVTQRESRAIFEVEDECGGMPEDLPPRLFQPFTQGHADKSGFGLGLTIVKQVVQAHRGAVRVANRPGQGCSFIIDLPLRHVDEND